MTERMLRLCDVCFKLDDHPRHVAAWSEGEVEVVDYDALDKLPEGVPARAMAELLDNTTSVRHLHCCANKGCASCREDLARTGWVEGDELLQRLQEL